MSFVNAVARGTSLNEIYTIGSVIIKNAPWAGFAGQTWEVFARGKTLVCEDPNQSVADQSFADFTTLGGTGGDVKHTLTTDEMPSHRHTYTNFLTSVYFGFANSNPGNTGFNNNAKTSYEGGNQPHPIVQPYQVVLYYRRSA